MDIRSPLFKNIAAMLAGILFINPVVSLGANLALDAAAGGNAHLSQAGNGVPVVNIATPNAKGLSHNRFNEYNVGQQGLILNNATQATQSTQLGGIILGNQNLSKGAAGLILNEVTGSNPSQLRGYTEVAGQAAGVIVANPHGISCDGCGFINTPRVTLSTGKPIIEQGELSRFDVERGTISIQGDGLNASNIDQFDLITRSARINAELHAQNLNIITGRNEVDARTLEAQAKSGTSQDAPQLAIDSSALGGMYAGAIRLVGTEQGVGVRLAGDLAASAGDIQIDASGKLTLGNATAGGQLTARSAGLEAQGDLYAGNRLELGSRGELTSQGLIAAQNAVVLRADGTLNNQGHIEAGVNTDGSRNAQGDLALQAARINNPGTLVANRDLTVDAQNTLDNRDGQVVAQRNAVISAGQFSNSQGRLSTGGDLELTAVQVDNRGGRIASVGSLELQSGGLSQQGGELLSQGDMRLDLGGGVLDNEAGLILAEGDLQLTHVGAASNRTGEISSRQQLSVQADSLDNQAGKLLAEQRLELTGQALDNRAGLLAANTDLQVDVAQIDNRGGAVSAQEALVISAAALDNSTGGRLLGRELSLSADNLINQQGRIEAHGPVRLNTATLDNTQGQLIALGELTLSAGQVGNRAGRIASTGPLVMQATGLDQQGGELYSQDRLSLDLQGGVLINDNGLINAPGALLLRNLGVVSNRGGEISSPESFDLTASQLDNREGLLLSEQALSTQITGQLDNRGGRISGHQLTLAAATLDNSADGLLRSHTDLDIQLSGTLDNQGGRLLAEADLALLAGDIDNQQGQIASRADITAQFVSLRQAGGELLAEGRLNLSGQSLDNQAGLLVANGELLLDIAEIDNRAGEISSSQNLVLSSQQLDNSEGGRLLGRHLDLAVERLLNRTRGLIYGRDGLNVNAALLDNSAGSLASETSLVLTLNATAEQTDGALINQAGLINSEGTLSVRAQQIDNRQGTLSSAASLQLDSQGQLLNQAGRVLSDADIAVRSQTLDNNAGQLSANTTLAVDSGDIDNQQGQMVGLERLELQAGQVDNRQGRIASGDRLNASLTGLEQQGGELFSQRQLSLNLNGGALNNDAGLISAPELLVLNNLGAVSNRSGEISSAASFALTAHSLDNSAGRILSDNGLTLGIERLLSNLGGLIGGARLNLDADSLDNREGTLFAQGQLALTVSDALDNRAEGLVQAGSALLLHSGRIDNQGGYLLAAGDALIQVDSELDNRNGGLINSQGQLQLQTSSLDSSQGGEVSARGDLELLAGELRQAGGALIGGAGLTLDLQQGSLDNQSGLISAQGPLTLENLQSLDNRSGEIVSQGPLVLKAALLDNRAGHLISRDWLSLTLGQADNRGGLLSGWQGLALTGGSLDNRQAGTLSSRSGDVTVGLSGQLLNSAEGALVASGQLAVSAASLDNSQQGILSSAGNQQLQVTGSLNNSAGQIDAGQALSIEAQHLTNQQGLVLADQNLQLRGTGLDNSGGRISSGAATDLALSGALNNQAGQLASTGPLEISAAELDNRGGTLASQAGLVIDAQRLDNSAAGTLAANDALVVQLSGTLANHDDGLIFSRDAGLDIRAYQLDNQGGSLQGSGDLSLTLDSDLLNRDGQLISQAGDIAIAADNLDNRQGVIASLSGWVRAQLSGWLNNGDASATGGLIQAQQLELAASANLSNQNGRLHALGGSAQLSAGAINNQAGVLYAQDQLVLTGTSFDNRGGQIGAGHIDLGLSAGLNNQSGIIESSTQLLLQAASLDNRNGQLRALGNGGTSFFQLGGQLNNTSGVLEVASQHFNLAIGSLANQSGRLLHTGQGELGLTLAQINGAGGEIITRGGLSLSGSTWTNSGLVQAGHLTLDIGNLTQTANGQLLASEGLTGQGSNWSNAGLIASDGSLSLALAGGYSGSGRLTSLGDLTLNAASLTLSESGSIAAGGHGQLSLGNQLLNHGRITAAGDLNLQAATLNNHGTLGSATDLTLTAETLLNEQGLIFSGGDMRLYANHFTNRYADVYSLGDVSIEGRQPTQRSTLLENISATIEAAGNLVARTWSLINRKDQFELTEQQTYGQMRVHCYDCSGDHHNVDYIGTEIFTTQITADSPSALLLSGTGMALETGALSNRYSTIATGGNLLIEAASLDNIGAAEAETTRERAWNTGRITDGTDHRFRTAHIVPYNNAELPKELPVAAMDERNYALVRDITTVTPTGVAAHAIIQAAGAATVRVAGDLNNEVVLHQAVAVGNARTGDTSVGNAATPVVVTLNPQLPPDLAQQQVNPLTLPGFSLPTGQNGLFRLSGQEGSNGQISDGAAQQGWAVEQHTLITEPARDSVQGVQTGSVQLGTGAGPTASTTQGLAGQGAGSTVQVGTPTGQDGLYLPPVQGLPASQGSQPHKYLIETNPALTDLKQFMGSDYLLANMGFDPDQAQKRLGDGLYEQRLVREAVMAHTGQRYLAGLTSDEAMFRYLMDNALASKDALGLALGVSLSAEQVAALTHDIVWLEEHEVMGERVLVPVLYLAQPEGRLMANGALIQGNDLTLISGGELNNQGTLRAANDLGVMAGNIANSGLIEAGNRLALLSDGDISNRAGGIIAGRDVSLAAGGDILNERSATYYQNEGERWRQVGTLLDNAARIEATGDLSLSAGRDLLNLGGVLEAAGDARLSAGNDLLIGAVEERSELLRQDRRHHWENISVTQHGSELTIGGSLELSAGQDLGLIASRVQVGDDLTLSAGNDVLISSAANEQTSLYRYRRSDKKVTRENSQIEQQGSELLAGGNVSVLAGQDMTVLASRLQADGDIGLYAEGDINLLSALDESSSFYLKQKKKSFGRSSARQTESYTSTNVATQIEAGGNLLVNVSLDDQGAVTLEGGQNVTLIGSQLTAGADLAVGALNDIAVLSGVEEHGSYSKKTKSGFLGLSKSGQSQLQTQATQVASELQADNDLLLLAGNDVRLRASHVVAGNDSEIRAGLVSETGDINLVSAQDQAYSLRESYRSKVGLSSSGNSISVASARKAGDEAISSTAVGSQVLAEQDALLVAERDINVEGSRIAAGRNVTLDAGRDVNVLAASDESSERAWDQKSQLGLSWSSDQNSLSLFAGKEAEQARLLQTRDRAVGSEVSAGQDVRLNAGRDINQVGSSVEAGRDINYRATDSINIVAAEQNTQMESYQAVSRQGIGVSASHNFGSTKEAVSNAGQGDNTVSQVANTLRAVDSVSHLLSGPSAEVRAGSSKQSSRQQQSVTDYQASALRAGNDINLEAGDAVTVTGSQLVSERDINIQARDIHIDVAQGQVTQDAEFKQSWSGARGGTSGGLRAGVGASRGTAEEQGHQGTNSVSQLQAGRDLNLSASNDLSLTGSQVTAGNDLTVQAGNDLLIRAAQTASSSDSSRRSAGGEVGVTIGMEGFGFYASANVGKGYLEREGTQHQEAYLYAGNRLSFGSGQDTEIAGAQLRANEVIGRVGRDLLVSSVADSGRVRGKESDFSATVVVGPAPSLSGSVGTGRSSGETHWVTEQTRISAADRLDIRTQNHTQLDGALIASDSGNLRLDTGSLGYSDIHGYDQERSHYVSVGGSYGLGATAQQDSSQVGKGAQGSSGWSLEGNSYERDRQQIVRATVGEGDIIVRNDADTGDDSTAGLNRDVSKAYEITRDKEERTDLYVSQSSLEAVGRPVETVSEWVDAIGAYGNKSAEAMQKLGELAEHVVDLLKDPVAAYDATQLKASVQQALLALHEGNNPQAAAQYLLEMTLGNEPEADILAARIAEIAATDGSLAVQTLAELWSLQSGGLEQQFAPAIPYALGALALALSAAASSPDNTEAQSRAFGALMEAAAAAGDRAQEQVMRSVALWVVLVGTSLPIHELEPEHLVLLNPIVNLEGLTQWGDNSGYGAGGQVDLPTNTGGRQLDAPVGNDPYVLPEHQGGLGLVYSEGGVKGAEATPDFYVNASGETIPATGYRYVSSDAPYLQDLLSNGIIPANSRGTYISFDNLGQGAAGKLQVPHDAAIKIEFDTKQILGDVQIPKGQWGEADYPEPITNDFPQFGPGGATQAVTTKPIVVNKVIDARTGKVLYERGQ